MDLAACSPHNNNEYTVDELTEIFFPGRGRNDLVKKALAICDTCPVRQDCLEFSYYWRMTKGVWGGISEHYRRNVIFPRWGRDPHIAAQRVPLPEGDLE